MSTRTDIRVPIIVQTGSRDRKLDDTDHLSELDLVLDERLDELREVLEVDVVCSEKEDSPQKRP